MLDKTGTALVVATVTTLEGNDPADYANRLYEQWGIGRAGEDRGVLLLLVIEERRVRIETGYGVEGILPDGRVGELLDRFVVPLLAQGQYGPGLRNGMAAVAQVVADDAGVTLGDGYRPRTVSRRGSRQRGLGMLPLLVLLALAGVFSRGRGGMLPFVLLMLGMGAGRGRPGGFDGFGGGFGGFGGGLSGGGGAGRGF